MMLFVEIDVELKLNFEKIQKKVKEEEDLHQLYSNRASTEQRWEDSVEATYTW